METAEAPPSHQNGAVKSPTPLHAQELENYTLPTYRLTTKLEPKDEGRTPLVLCACGSFSPITFCMFSHNEGCVRGRTLAN
jgi:hypothetical protein